MLEIHRLEYFLALLQRGALKVSRWLFKDHEVATCPGLISDQFADRGFESDNKYYVNRVYEFICAPSVNLGVCTPETPLWVDRKSSAHLRQHSGSLRARFVASGAVKNHGF